MMGREIFKVQVPLESNDPNPPALAYNRTRSIQSFIPMSEELRIVMDGAPKKFFYAEKVGGTLAIDGEAPAQDW